MPNDQNDVVYLATNSPSFVWFRQRVYSRLPDFVDNEDIAYVPIGFDANKVTAVPEKRMN